MHHEQPMNNGQQGWQPQPGYPQQGYPQQGGPGAAPPARRRSRAGLWVALGLALVLVLGVGAWLFEDDLFDGPSDSSGTTTLPDAALVADVTEQVSALEGWHCYDSIPGTLVRCFFSSWTETSGGDDPTQAALSIVTQDDQVLEIDLDGPAASKDAVGEFAVDYTVTDDVLRIIGDSLFDGRGEMLVEGFHADNPPSGQDLRSDMLMLIYLESNDVHLSTRGEPVDIAAVPELAAPPSFAELESALAEAGLECTDQGEAGQVCVSGEDGAIVVTAWPTETISSSGPSYPYTSWTLTANHVEGDDRLTMAARAAEIAQQLGLTDADGAAVIATGICDRADIQGIAIDVLPATGGAGGLRVEASFAPIAAGDLSGAAVEQR